MKKKNENIFVSTEDTLILMIFQLIENKLKLDPYYDIVYKNDKTDDLIYYKICSDLGVIYRTHTGNNTRSMIELENFNITDENIKNSSIGFDLIFYNMSPGYRYQMN